MKPFLLCLLLVLPASAQRKLWTWTPPNQADDVAHHILLASSSPTGAAAVVYAEIDFAGQTLEAWTFKAAFISPKGVLLKTIDLPLPQHYAQERLFTTEKDRWKCISITKTGAVLSDGEHVVKFATKGKEVTTSIISSDFFDENDFLPLEGGLAPLAGWLKRNKEYVAQFTPTFNSEPIKCFRLTSVELWSAK